MKPFHGFVMLGLAVAVVVLGYLYYEETKKSADITIDVPDVTIKND